MSTTIVSSSIVVPSIARRASHDDPPRHDDQQSTLKRSADDHGENERAEDAQEGNDVRRASLSAQEAPKRPRLDLSNPDVKKRGQRMFANILGTLTKFKADAAQKTEAEIQREQIDATLQEKLRREKVELAAKVQREQEERRQRIMEKKKESDELREAEIRRTWTAQKSNLTNFLHTKTAVPILYYLPRKLTNEMTSIIAEQKRALVLASAAISTPTSRLDDPSKEMDVEEHGQEHRSGSEAETDRERRDGHDDDETQNAEVGENGAAVPKGGNMCDDGPRVGPDEGAPSDTKDQETSTGGILGAGANTTTLDLA